MLDYLPSDIIWNISSIFFSKKGSSSGCGIWGLWGSVHVDKNNPIAELIDLLMTLDLVCKNTQYNQWKYILKERSKKVPCSEKIENVMYILNIKSYKEEFHKKRDTTIMVTTSKKEPWKFAVKI